MPWEGTLMTCCRMASLTSTLQDQVLGLTFRYARGRLKLPHREEGLSPRKYLSQEAFPNHFIKISTHTRTVTPSPLPCFVIMALVTT